VPEAIEPAEIDQAEVNRIVRAHPELESLVKGWYRTVFIQPNTADRGQSEGADQVVVGLHDYEQNRSVIALVDVKAEKVMALENAIAPLQLSQEEREEAEALAAEDPQVKAFLGRRNMSPLTRLYFPPHAAREHRPHRFAIVFVRPSTAERRYAVVDLSQRQVVAVLTRHDLTGR
jgi:hypothetical protein